MSKKVFGFHSEVLGTPKMIVGLAPIQIASLRGELYAEANPPPVVFEEPPKLFTMSVPKRGGTPRCGEYENNPAGHRELASLVRGERVLCVVLGHQVKFEHASVVELASDGVTVTEKLVLPE